jgi:hypothetical protein
MLDSIATSLPEADDRSLSLDYYLLRYGMIIICCATELD